MFELIATAYTAYAQSNKSSGSGTSGAARLDSGGSNYFDNTFNVTTGGGKAGLSQWAMIDAAIMLVMFFLLLKKK